jgi:CheY-like chemotaxis protein
VKQPCILLVDDYLDALQMWGAYLRTLGYDVLTAENGIQAVDIAKEFIPDLIVMDLGLPGISGLEAARRIRQGASTAHIPLIAATGISQPARLEEARRLGFDAILIKPCEPGELLEQIRKSLAAAGQRASAISG